MRRFEMPIGRGEFLPAGRACAVMGVLNVTPDSFSDGGELVDVEAAVARAREMRKAGAAILDVGGESTRPGAADVDIDEELRRVVPVIRALVDRLGAIVSIDTRKAAVFRAAHEAGARILNDVSGLEDDPEMADAVGRSDASVVIMHMRGQPTTMDGLVDYEDVVASVRDDLGRRVERAEDAGIARDRIAVDPGLGFAKTHAQSLDLIRRVAELHALGLPIVAGPSRKRFVGAITGREVPRDRDVGTAALVAHLAAAGVEVVRVHAVDACVDTLRVQQALAEGLVS